MADPRFSVGRSETCSCLVRKNPIHEVSTSKSLRVELSLPWNYRTLREKELSKSKNSPPAPLVAALDQELRRRPYGTIRAMERALGRYSSWWHGQLRKGELPSDDVFAIAGFLGLDAVSFVRRHLGSPDGLELDRPQGPPPEIVETAWQRLCAEPSQGLGDDGPGVGDAFLDRLDQQRYRDPAAALRVAETVVTIASRKELPRLLAITGAALRAQIQLMGAEHAYYAAIQGALLLGDHRAVGNFLRWYTYLLLDKGRFGDALHSANNAAGLLLRENDNLGLAKVCVEQALCLLYLDRLPEALRALETALLRLPQGEARYRAAAHQNTALAYESMGRIGEAFRSLDATSTFYDALSTKHRAQLLLPRARLFSRLKDWASEEVCLRPCIDLLRRTHHGETALATCDLVRNLLVQRRPEEAFGVATSMRALVEPLRHNEVVSAAIAELLRSGREGLTLAIVRRVRTRIESGRQQRSAWLRLAA